jgi:hypothetical protein
MLFCVQAGGVLNKPDTLSTFFPLFSIPVKLTSRLLPLCLLALAGISTSSLKAGNAI